MSDEGGVLAFPHKVLLNDKEVLAHIARIIVEQEVGAVVVGESRDFSGNENPVMKEARAFAKSLAETSGIPIQWHPEVLTSVEARRGVEKRRKPVSRERRDGSEKEHIDARAAAVILQSFLDSRVRG